jgi:predicted GNAT family N-acyltransferase
MIETHTAIFIFEGENEMYDKVSTEKEMDIFKEIWYTVCEEKNFESEDFNPEAEHFLIKNSNGEYIGTMEIGEYKPDKASTVQEYYDFTQDERIKNNLGFVYEVDKVCIKKEERRNNGVHTIIQIFVDHATEHDARYYLAATEYIFYRAIRSFYGFGVEPKGEKLKYDGFYLMPSMLDAQTVKRVGHEVLSAKVNV